ncbi:hypothetical protein AGLY_015102 [Aphis glycines]|uniref:RNA-directed DNA polymerase n=1 Tax=Aphis glycines TaxID=307491 RepID=A0A6G0T2T8_APHGL|nr:hypothetical protein AGLY_015102 [Aphis glycines]
MVLFEGNVKETIGTLLEALKEYYIVTEITKQYNFTSGIKYEIKRKLEINSFLSAILNVKQFHDSKLGGHLGVNKTIKRIQKQFRWKGMKDDVKKYIKNCTSCQVNKISNRHVKQPMAITSTSTKPFEKIFLDIVGPLPTTLSSNNYILTMQDDLSKYTLGVPIPNHQANTVAEAFVIHFVCVHGIPGTILTDQGTDFLSKTFTEVCKLLKINKVNTSPFRPQTNGGLERSHRTLAEYLRHYVDKNLNNWDHLLPYAFFVYNSTVHTSTNFQPYSMQVSHKLAREKLIEHKVKIRNNAYPTYPGFTTFISRLKTFNSFPLTSPQDKYSLTESGFIYSRKKDIVECFCCGLILHHWEKEDNPWIEHSRWNPKCVYVLLSKGNQFVENVVKKYGSIELGR